MNLQKIALDKIKELGYAEAAKYFQASQATVKRWETTGSPPVSAVQKVLDEQGEDVKLPPDPVKPEPPPSVEIASSPLAAIPPQPVYDGPNPGTLLNPNLPPTPAWMDATEKRLDRLEDFARKIAAVPESPISLVRPISQGETYVMPEPPVNDPSPKVAQIMGLNRK